MTHVVVIGAGIAGLSAALMLARRGHSVDLLERDRAEPSCDLDDCFERWERRGVGHIRQTHQFLSQSTKILREEAPEFLDALTDAGGTLREKGYYSQGLLDYPILHARRTTFEAILRRIVAAEQGVVLRSGMAVSALVAQPGGGTPIVTGVRTEDGTVVAADLVVDASGRRTPAKDWLTAIGARTPVEEGEEVDFQYITRWYRYGGAFPALNGIPAAVMRYGMVMVMPADRGFFSITFIACRDDPLRTKLIDGLVFDRVVARIPLTSEWIGLGTPVSRPLAFANVGNRLRRLVDRQGPIVGGFVLAGDSFVHTNPTQARGASLALAQAQRIAQTARRVTADPVAYVRRYDRWGETNLRPWFEAQVEFDAENSALWRAFFAGTEQPSARRRLAAWVPASDANEAARLDRLFALLATPNAVGDELAGHVGDPPPDALPRAEFERLIANAGP